jgi:TetR/AcrR family transcriptional regulator of autoinduction and epiphytic fitness
MTPMSRRPYDASRRRAAAGRNQSAMLDAARTLFAENGYAATTLTQIAATAGVSPASVAAAFGGKAGLLRRLVDVGIVGDDQPVPLGERPEARRIAAETDPHRQIEQFAALVADVHARLAGLQGILAEAAGADEQVRQDLVRMQRGRRAGMAEFTAVLAAAGHLRPGLGVEKAADVVWALTEPRLFVGLCHERGWSTRSYAELLAGQLAAALLAEPGRGAHHDAASESSE